MKTKPKLMNVLVPPISLMMMQHHHQSNNDQRQHAYQENNITNGNSNSNSVDGSSSSGGDGDGGEISIATREALYASLAKNRPLAGLMAPTGNSNQQPLLPPSGYKLQHVTYHPCKSLAIYLFGLAEDNTESSGVGIGGIGIGGPSSSSSSSSPYYDPNNNCNKWIIVQDTKTRHIVFSITLEDLAIQAATASNTNINSNTNSKSSNNNSNNYNAIHSVSQFTFLDQSTLYWDGYASASTATTERNNKQDNNNNKDGRADNNNNNENRQKRSWSYLMIHCPNRIVIVDLRQQRQKEVVVVVADITSKSLQTQDERGRKGGGWKTIANSVVSSSPSNSILSHSNAVIAISQTQLLFAVLDGSFIIYDWNLGKVIQKTMKWTGSSFQNCNFTENTKTTDCIIQILSVNPYSYDPAEAMAGDNDNNNDRRRRRMIICVTKKAIAYLCDISDFTATTSNNNNNNGNGNEQLLLLLPIARMEGGSVPPTIEETYIASMEHIIVRYDALRDLFFWMVPSKNHKSKLFVWELSSIITDIDIAENNNNSNSTNTNTNTKSNKQQKRQSQTSQQQLVHTHDPILITQFSYEDKSHMVYPGWVHESFPSDCVTCLAVTKDGELQLSVAPLYNSGSTRKNPFLAATVWSVKLSQVMIRDLQIGQGQGGRPSDYDTTHFKVQSVKYASSLQDPSIIFVGTTIGILTIKLLDGLTGVPSPGTRFVHFNANLGTMGKSILSVHGSQISYSPLESPSPSSLDNTDDNNNDSNTNWGLDRVNPIGKMEYYYSAVGGGGGGGGGIKSTIFDLSDSFSFVVSTFKSMSMSTSSNMRPSPLSHPSAPLLSLPSSAACVSISLPSSFIISLEIIPTAAVVENVSPPIETDGAVALSPSLPVMKGSIGAGGGDGGRGGGGRFGRGNLVPVEAGTI
eukprot:CAMPEP_0170882026 /NCGR_PEP_ID=MMETSP0734-20130129/33430_1 /TAXON_ID=186038 /ORGANISM="Fragilariopsis kerguelensis, Strain L26-C5" /LENGTH=913 /DNA_ID=CAMNT_0011265951 /DNA_START=21 /DNA_END=2762 /DNA_ORIENTATION=-